MRFILILATCMISDLRAWVSRYLVVSFLSIILPGETEPSAPINKVDEIALVCYCASFPLLIFFIVTAVRRHRCYCVFA